LRVISGGFERREGQLKQRSPERITGVSRLSTESTYRKSILPHGIRVVTETIPHVRSASVGIWIDAGSRDERPELSGISHFIEHMVFKGTKRRSVREIAQSIESVGGYLNAFTGKEHTCYYARILDEHIDLALDVLADMVLQASFPAGELEKEKGVVIEELKQTEDDPDDIIHDYFEKELFGSHPLGSPVIGTEQSLRRLSRKNLVDYRNHAYTAERIVVAAAGNLTHAHIVETVERILAPRTFPRAHSNDPRIARSAPQPFGKTFEKEYPRSIQQAHVVLGTVGYSVQDEERFPLMVLNTLLGDGMSSRLFQNIREKYGFAYTVYSFANLLSDSGTVGAYVGTDKAHIRKCIDLVWKEFDAVRRKPVSVREIERTKTQLKGNMMLSLENIPNRMIRLGSSELYYGELASLDSIIQKIDAVTPERVHAIAQALLQEERFCTVVFRPNGKAAVHED